MHLHGWCFQTAGGIQQEVGLPCAVLAIDAVVRCCGFNSGPFGVANCIKMELDNLVTNCCRRIIIIVIELLITSLRCCSTGRHFVISISAC